MARLLAKIAARLLTRPVWASIQDYMILSFGFGHYRTSRRWECIDKDDNPIPWFTYPAIEYLKQIDLSDKTLFEYGSGYSTLFWAQRCQQVISVEDDREWHNKISKRLPSNVQYKLLIDKAEYVSAIQHCSRALDIIVIDGKYRRECAAVARDKLAEDGFMILDNSDWYPQTSQFLRDSDLIEVDMSGFGPIVGFTSTTSLYFSRKVRLKSAGKRQPVPGIGASILTESRDCADG
jgi:hypothetical protein